MYRAGLTPATFVGGDLGGWSVDAQTTICGEPLAAVARLDVHEGTAVGAPGTWALRGIAGHARYVERHERAQLDAVSPALGRLEARRAALIPIRKSPAWWALAQDERRAIFEDRSHHIADSLRFLPRIARRLYHSRDLGEAFDFLTWFEFAAGDAAAFDELVSLLRSREEWTYVDREVDLRLTRP
jgi:hypothetical protein